MNSDSSIRSPRVDGTKSTGPATPPCERRSSAASPRPHSLTHQRLAQTLRLSGEDAEAFYAILASLERDFRPNNFFEDQCLVSMAVARWKSLRYSAIEKIMRQAETRLHADTSDDSSPLIACSGSERARALDRLRRYQNRYKRQYNRAYKMLLDMKKNVFCPLGPSPKNGHLSINS